MKERAVSKKTGSPGTTNHVLCTFLLILILPLQGRAAHNPNIIILIADDMGWRDTGYSGNPVAKTPTLDDMATKGLRFDYFYAGGDMCCPGRYAILTGRAPYRGGIHGNQRIQHQEIILPRALKLAGYRSAYFGKWHLGSGQTGPIAMGFDQATWQYGEFDLDPRFLINDTKEFIQMKGDGSLAVMDLALEYVRRQAKDSHPFLVIVGFGSPHSPHRAAPEFKALYKNVPENLSEYYGEISGLDAAVGRLREELRRLNIAENTFLWFTSDNPGLLEQSREPTGRGKGSVGARTVSVLEWPGHVKKPMRVGMPCGHVDIYPTILDFAGVQVPQQPILDGISLVPLLDGKMDYRPKPLGFMQWGGGGELPQIDFVNDTQGVWIDGKNKLIVESVGSKERKGTVRLYDIFEDPAEKTNLVQKLPDVVARMRVALDEWKRSVRASYDGKDFAKKQ